MAQEVYNDLNSLECLNTSQPIDSADLLGKVVVLLSWRDTEVISLSYLNKLKEWAAHYSQNMVVVGLYSPKFPSEKNKSEAEAMINYFDIDFPVYFDVDGVYRKIYGLKREPGVVVFDQLGRRRSIGYGNIDLKSVHDLALSLMNQGQEARLNRTTNSIMLERPLEEAQFLRYPTNLLYLESEKQFLVSDTAHHRVLLANLDGKVTKVIGTGVASDEDGDLRSCSFRYPRALCILDGIIYVADSGNHKVKAIDLASGVVRSLVGTGVLNFHQVVSHRGNRLSLASPMGLAAYSDENGPCLLISNTASRQILRYDVNKDEVISYIANGRDKFVDDIYRMASMMQPTAINTELPGFIFTLDSDFSSIRLAHKDFVKTLYGSKDENFARGSDTRKDENLLYPIDLAWDAKDNFLIVDSKAGCIRNFKIKTNQISEMKDITGEALRMPMGITRVKPGHFLVSDGLANKVYNYFSEEKCLEPISFNFSQAHEESKERVDALPKYQYLDAEIKEQRKHLNSVELVININLPDGYTLNKEAGNEVLAYEKHMTHWYLVRRSKVDPQMPSLRLKLMNVGHTEHYVVDVKLNLTRVGTDFETKECNFRLHIEKADRGGSKPVSWDVSPKG